MDNIRESVDSLCRDGADAQYMQYLKCGSTCSSIMEALSFVKQLELAEDEVQLIRSAKISAVKEQKEQGFVDAGSLGISAVCTSQMSLTVHSWFS